MNLEEIKLKINKALDKLYEKDCFLINEGLCERCINHKFALYLERQNFGNDYYIDCEYNKSHLNKITISKKVSSGYGNYIDIIITKRDGNHANDLICFEVKKWNNYNNRKKDRKNLMILTGGDNESNGFRFGYDYGFYIIFGTSRNNTKIEIYEKGKLIEEIKNLKNLGAKNHNIT